MKMKQWLLVRSLIYAFIGQEINNEIEECIIQNNITLKRR